VYTPYKTTRRRKVPSLKVPTLTLYYLHAYTTTRRRKEPSLKVPTLTPYYVHTLEDHQKK
jgi:hypothetical protein